MSNKILCNNCENYGHLFYNCKRPITSLGIICFRKNITNNSIEYLLKDRCVKILVNIVLQHKYLLIV